MKKMLRYDVVMLMMTTLMMFCDSGIVEVLGFWDLGILGLPYDYLMTTSPAQRGECL